MAPDHVSSLLSGGCYGSLQRPIFWELQRPLEPAHVDRHPFCVVLARAGVGGTDNHEYEDQDPEDAYDGVDPSEDLA